MLIKRSKRLAAGVAAIAAVATLCSANGSAVVGGHAISVSAAPWSAYIKTRANEFCGGSIIDSLHVVTAAHCLYMPNGSLARGSQIAVKVGISNFRRPRATDAEQDRRVGAIRVDPKFVWWATGSGPPGYPKNDVAVLSLSRPLDLTGPNARAVALPAANIQFGSETQFTFAGFGLQNPAANASGELDAVELKLDAGNASCEENNEVCVSSPGRAVCRGDSGAGLVTTGPTPTLVGIASRFTDFGSQICARGRRGYFDVVNTALVTRFIHANTPPGAPSEPPATQWVPSGWRPVLGIERLGIAFALPRTWGRAGPDQGAVLSAQNSDPTAQLNLVYFPNEASQSRFFAYVSAADERFYRKSDPNATRHSRVVKLPGGEALETSTQFAWHNGTQVISLLTLDYHLFRKGAGFEIQFICRASDATEEVPIFKKAARTAHFVSP